MAVIFYYFVMTDPHDDNGSTGAGDELAKLKDMAARAQADLQNAKARMEREAQEIRTYAMQGLIEKLLPTIDNFQRAFDHLPEELATNDWVKGLMAMEQQLVRDLESVGLTKIDAMGQPVDSAKHDVLQAAEGEKDTVVQVLENGYELNGKVIRPAKVVVGSGS